MSGLKFLSQSKVVTSNPNLARCLPTAPVPENRSNALQFFLWMDGMPGDSLEKKNFLFAYLAWNYWPPTRGLMWGSSEMTPVWKMLLSLCYCLDHFAPQGLPWIPTSPFGPPLEGPYPLQLLWGFWVLHLPLAGWVQQALLDFAPQHSLPWRTPCWRVLS